MGTYPSFANESQPQGFEVQLSGNKRILSIESAKPVRRVLGALQKEGPLESEADAKTSKTGH